VNRSRYKFSSRNPAYILDKSRSQTSDGSNHTPIANTTRLWIKPRNDSMKHTRKHKKGREESNQEAKHIGSGGPSGQEGRTVRTGLVDRPACCRGPSAPTLRIVWPYAANRPIKHTEPTEATREKRTVREDRADRPRGSQNVRY
jgi:hypothetical protein